MGAFNPAAAGRVAGCVTGAIGREDWQPRAKAITPKVAARQDARGHRLRMFDCINYKRSPTAVNEKTDAAVRKFDGGSSDERHRLY
jgi:hypothetical protein